MSLDFGIYKLALGIYLFVFGSFRYLSRAIITNILRCCLFLVHFLNNCRIQIAAEMDIKRKASEGIVAIPAKKSRNELSLRYGPRNDFDENVSSQTPGPVSRAQITLSLIHI